LQIKAFVGLHRKKAIFKPYINQQLGRAMGLRAVEPLALTPSALDQRFCE
jgi:hypothetical protein